MTIRTGEHRPTSGRSWTRRPWALASGSILAAAAVAQVVLAVVLYDSARVNDVVANLGWALLWVSAAFGMLPIPTLRRYGRVPKGRSYMETTVLVDRGIYAIVRHPQYLAGILLGLGLSLVAQHWAVALPGLVVGLTSSFAAFDEEKELTERFGPAYEAYRRRVPRVNAARGLLRYLRGTR